MRRAALAVLLGTLLALGVGAAAWSYWTMSGTGAASAATGELRAAGDVVATAPVDSSTVTVAWRPGALGTGEAATAYHVERVRDSDGTTYPACGSSATSPTSGLGCSDLGVVDGTYHYVVTAAFGSWSARSASSPSVTVVNDSSLPSVQVTSISPMPNGNGWNNTSPVSVQLSATAGAGIASVTYAVDGGAPVTETSSTPTVPVSGDGVHTVTASATDTNGSVSETQSVVVRIDRSAPPAPGAPVLTAASDTGASATDTITRATRPTVIGVAETGATVVLLDGTTPVGSAVAVDGAYSVTVTSALAAGVHVLTTLATDPAANTGPASASTSITVDVTAPATPGPPTLDASSDSGRSSTDRITNVTTPTLSGSAEPGTTIGLLSSTTTSVGTGTAAASGAYAVTATTLTTGAKSLTVRATDVAGNVSVASTAVVVTIDVTAPARPGTPAMAAASDTGRSSTDRNTRVTTPTITGSTTSGATTTVFDGSTAVGTVLATSTTYAVTTSTLAQGSHTVTTRATDAAGNQSTASNTATVVIDTVAPLTPAAPALASGNDTGRSSSDRITTKTAPAMSGTNESRAIVSLLEGTASRGAVTTSGTTYAVTSAVLGQGAHALAVTQTDIAGNLSPTSATVTVTVDTTAPAVPSVPVLAAASDTGASSSDRVTNRTTPTLGGTADDTSLVQLLSSGVATGTAVVATGGSYTAVTSTLAGATYSFGARATDVAGNLSAISATVTVVVDTVAPTVTLNQASGQADPTAASPVAFTATFSEAVTGFIGTDLTLGGTAPATTAVVGGAGPGYDVLLSGMTRSGTVVPSLASSRAQDLAGNNNVAATSTDATVTFSDVVAPAAPSAPLLAAASDTGVSATDGITNKTTPALSGTAEPGATVRLLDGTVQVGSVVAATTGTWSITSSTLANGSHSLAATATDSSGNAGAASSATVVTIDTVAPTVTLDQAPGQADPATTSPIAFTVRFSSPVTDVTGAGVTIGGTAGATAFAIRPDGATYVLTVSGMTRSGTVVPTLAAGAAKDVAGNLSAAATSTDRTVTWTDAVAPGVSITTFTGTQDGSQAVSVTGVGGYEPGDGPSVTVVLCTTDSVPCAGTAVTLSGVVVNPSTGAWSVTSSALGAMSRWYARATQTDQSGNAGHSAVAGPVTTG